jgi:tetratricopeptide (TPR) repeat protein
LLGNAQDEPVSQWELSPRCVALVAAGAALLLRLAYVLLLRHDLIFALPVMDGAVHDGWARGDASMLRIFETGVPYFRAPLYIWFLRVVYFFNDSYLAPRLAQILLSAVTVGVVADLGRRFAGSMAGLLGGLLLAACWPAIYFSAELLIVTFFMFLVMAALWLLVVGTERDNFVWVGGGAFLLGVSALARPTSLVMLPALAMAPWWLWSREGGDRIQKWSPSRASLVLVALALLPGLVLTARNKVVGDDWVFIASQGGVNLYIGNNPQSDGRTAVVPGTRATWLGGYEDTRRMAEADAGRPLRASEVSSYFVGQSLRSWGEDPGAMVRLYAKKLRYLLGAGERPNNKNLHFWRDRNALLRLPIFPSWATLLALGVTGILLLERRRRAYFVWAFLALYALGLLPFFLNERFRLPLTVGLAVFAGIPLARGIAALLQKRTRLAVVAFAPVALLFTISELDRLDFRDDRIDADAFSRYTLGSLYARQGDRSLALANYRESLDVAHSFGLRNFESVERVLRANMVRVLIQDLKLTEAQQHLDFLAAGGVSTPELSLLRAQLLLKKNEFARAAPLFRKILESFPDQPDALLGIGWCQIQNRAFVAAAKSFRRQQRLVGVNAEALAGIGVAELLGNQNDILARRHFEQALGLDPEVAGAHQYMAEIYRRERNISKMTYHLEEALRLDPYNQRVQRFYNRLQAPPKQEAEQPW